MDKHKVRVSNHNFSTKFEGSQVHNDVEGGDLMRVLKNPVSSVVGVFKGIRNDYRPNVYKYILKNYKEDIVNITVFRQQINSGVTTAMNVATMGNWDASAKKVGYDNFFHLGMYLHFRNGKLAILEKNSVIELYEVSSINEKLNKHKSAELKEVRLIRPFELGYFMKNGEKKMGDGYFHYNAFNNNCQVFVINMLKATPYIKVTDDLEKFIYQNKINEVVKEQNPMFQNLVQTTTDMGGLADKFLEGDTDRQKIKDEMKDEISEQAYKGGDLITTDVHPSSYYNNRMKYILP